MRSAPSSSSGMKVKAQAQRTQQLQETLHGDLVGRGIW
jgi:hypothetical protein